jgi:hypothetical protein
MIPDRIHIDQYGMACAPFKRSQVFIWGVAPDPRILISTMIYQEL